MNTESRLLIVFYIHLPTSVHSSQSSYGTSSLYHEKMPGSHVGLPLMDLQVDWNVCKPPHFSASLIFIDVLSQIFLRYGISVGHIISVVMATLSGNLRKSFTIRSLVDWYWHA